MSRTIARPGAAAAAAAAVWLAAMPAAAQNLPVPEALAAHVWCARDTLQAAVDFYLDAQQAGDAGRLNAASTLIYKENRAEADIGAGILTRALGIDHSISLLDEYQCQTFTEIVDADGDRPYVLGVHLKLDRQSGQINYIDTLVTTTGDWLFNARNTLHWSQTEDWNDVPEGIRHSRQDLRDAANSYLDLFNDKTVKVKWAFPCRRLEGGAYTGRGEVTDSCEVGVPDGVSFPIRDYVVDPAKNAVVALFPFGGENGLPDSHMFRVMYDHITNVHTITACTREGMTCPQVPDWDSPQASAARPPE